MLCVSAIYLVLRSVYVLIFLLKMGFCAAVNGGNNSFKKQKNGGVSLFRLSKDEKLKNKWFIHIRRENLQKQPPEVCFEKRCS